MKNFHLPLFFALVLLSSIETANAASDDEKNKALNQKVSSLALQTQYYVAQEELQLLKKLEQEEIEAKESLDHREVYDRMAFELNSFPEEHPEVRQKAIAHIVDDLLFSLTTKTGEGPHRSQNLNNTELATQENNTLTEAQLEVAAFAGFLQYLQEKAPLPLEQGTAAFKKKRNRGVLGITGAALQTLSSIPLAALGLDYLAIINSFSAFIPLFYHGAKLETLKEEFESFKKHHLLLKEILEAMTSNPILMAELSKQAQLEENNSASKKLLETLSSCNRLLAAPASEK